MCAKLNPIEIVGLFLVRNEDFFIAQAVKNVLGFCDRILIANNKSTDKTDEIIAELSRNHEKVKIATVEHPRESQDLVREYVGKNVWVFGVDGDELYDPVGLCRLRQQLLAGRYDTYYRIYGNVLHCTMLNESRETACGHLSPPSRNMTKLFNFHAFENWEGPFDERLHGGDPRYRADFKDKPVYRIHGQQSWDHSILRCLHVCFLRRSSSDRHFGKTRRNIMEQKAIATSRRVATLSAVLSLFSPRFLYKHRSYMQGERVKIDAKPFFSQ